MKASNEEKHLIAAPIPEIWFFPFPLVCGHSIRSKYKMYEDYKRTKTTMKYVCFEMADTAPFRQPSFFFHAMTGQIFDQLPRPYPTEKGGGGIRKVTHPQFSLPIPFLYNGPLIIPLFSSHRRWTMVPPVVLKRNRIEENVSVSSILSIQNRSTLP